MIEEGPVIMRVSRKRTLGSRHASARTSGKPAGSERTKPWKPPTNNTPWNSLDTWTVASSLVVHLLEIMVDPVAYSLANAPYEDEEIAAAELDRARDSMDPGGRNLPR